MFKVKSIALIIFSLFWAISSASESIDSLVRLEIELQDMLARVVQETNHTQKSLVNQQFADLFRTALHYEGAFDYPFDSLTNVGKQKSEDNTLRVFTWNLPQPRGLQQYFGFMLVNLEGQVQVYDLEDKRTDFDSPHLGVGSPSKWFGALYYELITQQYGGKTYYTLLGVDLNNIFSSKRIIEVVTLENGAPVFGVPIVRLRDRMISRVIFEYSSRATMILRWDKDNRMIVSSHLTPMQPTYAGNYQYYVPDLSFDGFSFTDGFWVYTPDIDARNPRRERASLPVQPPSENFDPGFLYRSGRGN